MNVLFRSALIPVILAFVAGLGACSGGPGQGPTALTPAEILTKSGEAMGQTNSFHFLLEHENGTTPIVFDLMMESADGDILKPDKLQADVVAKVGRVTARSKVIAIGDRTWVTNPFNQSFQELPSGTSIRQIFDPGVGVTKIVEAVKDPKQTGEETIDGVVCYVIEGTIDAVELRSVAPIAESGLTVNVRLLIGKSDFLARFIRLDGPLAAAEPATVARKVTLTKFNEPITIQPPQ